MKRRDRKIKEVISKLKNKLGDTKIKNISRPNKPKPDKKKPKDADTESKKKKKTPTAEAVGPRGGSFKVSATGKKIYESSRVKKSIEDYYKHIEEIDKFINQYKEFKGLM